VYAKAKAAFKVAFAFAYTGAWETWQWIERYEQA
jgi:hypothetical protein